MSDLNEVSPCKLLICHIIKTSFSNESSSRSDHLNELYTNISASDLDIYKKLQLEFIDKSMKGWEPSKSDLLHFLCNESTIAEFSVACIDEFTDEISNSVEFVKWMVSLERWRAEFTAEDEEQAFGVLLSYVSSVVSSFSLLPFSDASIIATKLQNYLNSCDDTDIVLPSPFHRYSTNFTSRQRVSWMQHVQAELYSSFGLIDLNGLRESLQSIKPSPRPLLASLSLLRGDYAEAQTLLLNELHMRDTTLSDESCTANPPIDTVLLPLAQYCSSHAERQQCSRLLDELTAYFRRMHRTDMTSLVAFMSFQRCMCSDLQSERLNSLSLCLRESSKEETQQGLYRYAVYTAMREAILFPQGIMLQPLSDEVAKAMHDAGMDTDYKTMHGIVEVIEWLEDNGMNRDDLLLRYIKQWRDVMTPYMSSFDTLYADLLEAHGRSVNSLLHKYHFYTFPLLLSRVYQEDVIDAIRCNRDDASIIVSKWLAFISDVTTGNREQTAEEVKALLFRAVIESRRNNYRDALCCVYDAYKKAFQSGLVVSCNICLVVQAYITVNCNSLSFELRQRLIDAISIFHNMHLRLLVCWCLLLLCIDDNRFDIVERLKVVASEFKDPDLNCEIELCLFRCGVTGFSTVINQCAKEEALNVALRAVSIKIELLFKTENINDKYILEKKLADLRNKEFPWKHILCLI